MSFVKQLTVYLAAFAISLVAWILNSPQLYWMAGALVVLPQASRWLGKLEHRGLSVTRELPRTGHQGEAVTVILKPRNHLPLPKLQLELTDEPTPGLEPTDPSPIPVHLSPYGTDIAEYSLQLRRRGLHRLEAVCVSSEDLLGLCDVKSRLVAESQILVYPRIAPLPEALLPSRRGGGANPLETARRQGEGASFHGTREYRPGDPLRHVHWPTAARRSRLVVIEWESEESTAVLIAVETGAGTEGKLEHGGTLDLAAGLAASLAAAALEMGDSLRILAPGFSEWRAAPERGTGTLSGLLEPLARMTATSEIPLAAALMEALPQIAPGTLVCWLAPRPEPALIETARALRAARLRPAIYALGMVPSARRVPHDPWEAIGEALAAMDVPFFRLREDDDVVRRLLS